MPEDHDPREGGNPGPAWGQVFFALRVVTLILALLPSSMPAARRSPQAAR